MWMFFNALIVTITSYIFCDDPNPPPEFQRLSFWGRLMFYKKQLELMNPGG
jgi:hypothetical protein